MCRGYIGIYWDIQRTAAYIGIYCETRGAWKKTNAKETCVGEFCVRMEESWRC